MKNFIMLAAIIPMLMLGAKEIKPAKSVIEIWVWGGPSQLETFDPKPNAPFEYNNGYKAIPTHGPGIEVSEMLPKLAKHADKYAIIRTMTHRHNGHETASYLMQTGREPGSGKVFPAIGALVAFYKSKDYHGDLPPYVILTKPKGRFAEEGFLGEKYKPLVTGGNPNASRFSVDGITPPGNLTKEDIAMQFELLKNFDSFGKGKNIPALQEFDTAGSSAEKKMNGSAAKVFDLSLESAEMRDRYGRNEFGQACLTARRLVEAGVPYITINAQGWDSHKKHFETMKKKTAEMDQAVAALLEDLAEKGLLDTTIVWWSGEFGRTPKIQWEAPWNGGRNHYAKCFSAIVAGGGFQGGKVIGVSDSVAGVPVSRPVAPQDLLGSILERCGIDPDSKFPEFTGVDAPLLPKESKDGRLREIYPQSGKGGKK